MSFVDGGVSISDNSANGEWDNGCRVVGKNSDSNSSWENVNDNINNDYGCQ